ncbi:hypothetical protein RFI_12708 [Reticulomyxa filosa]|uniref:Sulfotransferase domain-containing protein n=1 Tax=Reticulomyxa filosa TaxID=46433 RepID=X6NEX6_RETFI|nr:hypothetical protein RFI_12708 [Reticulomyxa filosa]|eukprot:ETO24448.1 hypothetical protein RFI_12708 [Reticulomyxa filosa]
MKPLSPSKGSLHKSVHPVVLIVCVILASIVSYGVWYRTRHTSGHESSSQVSPMNLPPPITVISDFIAPTPAPTTASVSSSSSFSAAAAAAAAASFSSRQGAGLSSYTYNRTQAQQRRERHQSKVYASAEPFLVGLGAEKSGSTSLGDALFSSHLVSCPKDKGSDTETRFWSECITYDMDKVRFFQNVFVTKTSDRCRMQDYVTFGNWKNSAQKPKFEKSVDFFGVNFIAYLYTHYYIPKQDLISFATNQKTFFPTLFKINKGTKIFVMIRYPPPRIQSTYYFFVGNERTRLAESYGNVDKFAMHLLKNEELIKLRGMITDGHDSDDGNIAVHWNKWPKILEQWNIYMRSLVKQCLEESAIALFPKHLCNPPQLLRRAVGLSCYVVPIMEYLFELISNNFDGSISSNNNNNYQSGPYNMDLMLDSFRIIQTEMYVTQPSEVLVALMCWARHGRLNCDDPELKYVFTEKVKVKKLTSTGREKVEFSPNVLDALDSFFEPCHQRLFELKLNKTLTKITSLSAHPGACRYRCFFAHCNEIRNYIHFFIEIENEYQEKWVFIIQCQLKTFFPAEKSLSTLTLGFL